MHFPRFMLNILNIADSMLQRGKQITHIVRHQKRNKSISKIKCNSRDSPKPLEIKKHGEKTYFMKCGKE